MFRTMCLIGLAALVLVIGSAPNAAAFWTTINPTPHPTEVSTATSGGILDQLYGLGNLFRVEDNADQLWMNYGGSASARARYASLTESFGYLPGPSGGAFHGLFNVTTDGFISGISASFSPAQTGNPFRLALDPNSSPSAIWSSLMSDNSPGSNDHLVTWKIIGANGPHGTNTVGNYVVAWEDQNLGDADYNDLVVELGGVTPVPEPASVSLLGLGLLSSGILAWRRRRRQ